MLHSAERSGLREDGATGVRVVVAVEDDLEIDRSRVGYQGDERAQENSQRPKRSLPDGSHLLFLIGECVDLSPRRTEAIRRSPGTLWTLATDRRIIPALVDSGTCKFTHVGHSRGM